jgi:hypothetical protein
MKHAPSCTAELRAALSGIISRRASFSSRLAPKVGLIDVRLLPLAIKIRGAAPDVLYLCVRVPTVRDTLLRRPGGNSGNFSGNG